MKSFLPVLSGNQQISPSHVTTTTGKRLYLIERVHSHDELERIEV